jgi:transcriptional regulator with XRE-family HTH domain
MRIEERIGARVREARRMRGWSQEVLGEQVSRFLERPWSAQTVSAAENGGRDFVARDMLVLSMVLGQPIAWFYRPGMEALEEIVMPSGHTVKESEMRRAYGMPSNAAPALARELEKVAARVALLGEGEQT